MSSRSFYCVLSVILLLASLYETPVKAFHPMNVRKLYDFGNEGRYKKDDINLPLMPDEDVLELERLKQKPFDNLENPLDNLELINRENVLPTLQKQLETVISGSKSSLEQGQLEEEEHTVVQHKQPPNVAAAGSSHTNHEHHSNQNQDTVHNTNTAEKTPSSPVKPFYGAARLAFGQNPEVITTSSTTTTTTTTTTQPSTLLSLSSSSPSIPVSGSSITSMLEKDSSSGTGENGNGNGNGNDNGSVSAELEATTKNGERRSVVDTIPSKIAEHLLKHEDGHYSSFDMAQYVFWTGDEAGVARAVEELIQQGLMSRENAIKFLRDIRLGIEYLQNSYTNRIFPDHVKGNGYMFPSLQITATVSDAASKLPTKIPLQTPSTTKTTSTEKSLSIEAENLILAENLQKALEGIPSLLKLQELNNARKKENSIDYDEVAGRSRLADFLYAEYSLEEVIYQLAKVMFSQSLTQGSEQSQRALQRLTEFLETEGEHGRISPTLQKKVLDVLLAALSDTLGEHPELLAAARASLGNYFHKLPKPSLNP